MSFSIREGVEELRKKLEAEEVIAEKYPDAYLSDLPDGSHVWVSEGVQADEVRIVVGKDTAYFCPHVLVKGMAVFTTHWGHVHAGVLLMDLPKRNPELYKALVAEIVKKR